MDRVKQTEGDAFFFRASSTCVLFLDTSLDSFFLFYYLMTELASDIINQ